MNEIKTLVQEFKKDIKEKRKVVMGIKTVKSAKMENVVFLMELGMKEELDVVLDAEK